MLRSLSSWFTRTSTVENVRPSRTTSTTTSSGASNAAAFGKYIDACVTRWRGSIFDAATRPCANICPPSTTLRRVSRYGRADEMPGFVARRDVDEPEQVGGVTPCRELAGDGGTGVVARPVLLDLDADALLVERDVALDPRDLVERRRVGPHDVLLDRIDGRERPVGRGALERADREVERRLEELPVHVLDREVQTVDVLGLLDPDRMLALGEQEIPEPRAGDDAVVVPQVDLVVGVRGPGGLDLHHGPIIHADPRSGPNRVSGRAGAVSPLVVGPDRGELDGVLGTAVLDALTGRIDAVGLPRVGLFEDRLRLRERVVGAGFGLFGEECVGAGRGTFLVVGHRSRVSAGRVNVTPGQREYPES